MNFHFCIFCWAVCFCTISVKTSADSQSHSLDKISIFLGHILRTPFPAHFLSKQELILKALHWSLQISILRCIFFGTPLWDTISCTLSVKTRADSQGHSRYRYCGASELQLQLAESSSTVIRTAFVIIIKISTCITYIIIIITVISFIIIKALDYELYILAVYMSCILRVVSMGVYLVYQINLQYLMYIINCLYELC